ncbi:hypothetical protein Hanom_Chr15g01372861 [Helianthus anomalus]
MVVLWKTKRCAWIVDLLGERFGLVGSPRAAVVGIHPMMFNLIGSLFWGLVMVRAPMYMGRGHKKLCFFKAGKKSKRRRKCGAKNQSSSFMGIPNIGVESSEKGRPTKRNRAHLEEENDPFSLDHLLPQMNKRSDNHSSPPCLPGVNLNIPLDSSGVPVGGVLRASTEIPSRPPKMVQCGAGDTCMDEEGGEASCGTIPIDQ